MDLKKFKSSFSNIFFAISGDRCTVAAIMKLLSKQPTDITDSGQLYLAPLRKETGVN